MKMELNRDNDSLIVRYLDSEATYEEMKMLDHWVKLSEDNKIIFSQMVKAWEQSHISLQDENHAEERFFYFRKKLIMRKIRKVAFTVSTAAAVVLLVFAIRFFMPSTDDVLLSEVTFNKKKEIVLPDGSVVWLNKNSFIQYPEDFHSHRIVQLTGEAYFDVTENKDNPFVVETKDLTIRVVGTKFVVTDFGEEKKAEAVLESGEIYLIAQKTKEEFYLKPNQMISYDRELGKTQLLSVQAQNFTEWINNRLVFENDPMEDVFIQLEKWFGINIECNDISILQTPVSFTVDSETKEDIMNLLQVIVPFNWKQDLVQKEMSSTITVLPVK